MSSEVEACALASSQYPIGGMPMPRAMMPLDLSRVTK